MTWSWSHAADPSLIDEQLQVRSLKTQERNMIDSLDGLWAEQQALAQKKMGLENQLRTQEISLQQKMTELVRRQNALASQRYQGRRSLHVLLNLQRLSGLRYILESERVAEAWLRARWMKWVFQRRVVDIQQIANEIKTVQNQKNDVEQLTIKIKGLADFVDQTTRELNEKTDVLQKRLAEVRESRELHERALFDVREMKAALLTQKIAYQRCREDPFALLQGQLLWPVVAPIKNLFGRRMDAPWGVSTFQSGVVFGADENDEVVATSDGVVAFSGTVKNFGEVVMIQHSPAFITVYGPLKSDHVVRSENVKGGQKIGRVDATNNPGLYFEVRCGTIALDPKEWLSR